MDHQIPKSELIINSDLSVYHLGIKAEQLPSFLFLVGDPQRVPMVSAYFDTLSTQIEKREFVSHFGTYKSHNVGVISTGIGGDNIDIVLNELFLLCAANLETSTWKKNRKNLTLVRLGTSGTVDPSIALDSLLVSKSAIGLDGLAWYYEEDEELIAQDFISRTQWPEKRNTPYITYPDKTLLEKALPSFIAGNTLTASGFYRPQGRTLNGIADSHLGWQTLQSAEIHNLEMETAAIYFLAQHFGFKALSCNAILANRATGQFSNKAHETIEKMIQVALDTFLGD